MRRESWDLQYLVPLLLTVVNRSFLYSCLFWSAGIARCVCFIFATVCIRGKWQYLPFCSPISKWALSKQEIFTWDGNVINVGFFYKLSRTRLSNDLFQQQDNASIWCLKMAVNMAEIPESNNFGFKLFLPLNDTVSV